eukprot:TRINITY_DN15047_c0_g1_i8.p2 TRINITY_DN15047_c0_g1~~TRINITY_DN15047_c0_g1_i8.p2  ORF type:complete len:201 (+),score=56.21 TRINITY_DN15047_c0_g1_i8:698-1300(+)
MEKLEQIAAADWVIEKQDILRVPVRTTGIMETMIEFQNSQMAFIDVGGQRNERKKWIHAFDETSAVLFFVALSEYDQTLFEDQTSNRFVESLNLFENTLESSFLKNVPFIVVLTKPDVFKERLKISQLSQFFGEYKGDNDYESAKQFLIEKIKERTKDPENLFFIVQNLIDLDLNGGYREILSYILEVLGKRESERVGSL